MDSFIEVIRSVIAILFTFSVSIFVHELGHFMFAKMFGVRVETFSIGFGKSLWSRQWGETTYQISAIPFGGYVSMAGIVSKEMEKLMEEEAEANGSKKDTGSDDEASEKPQESFHESTEAGTIDSVMDELDALRAKPWWKRVCILAAGCINNLLTAALVYFLLGVFGFMAPAKISPVIHTIAPDVSLKTGLLEKDRFVTVNGNPVDSASQVDTLLSDAFETSASATVEVFRNNTTFTLTLPALLYEKQPLPGGVNATVAEIEGTPVNGNQRIVKSLAIKAVDSNNYMYKFGASFRSDGRLVKWEKPVHVLATLGKEWYLLGWEYVAPAYIGGVMPNLAAEKAGIKNGDMVLAVNKVKVNNRREALNAIVAVPGTVAEIVVERTDRKTKSKKIEVISCEVRPNPDNPKMGQIGIVWGSPQTEFTRYSPAVSLKMSLYKVWKISGNYLYAVGDLFTKSFQTIRENMGGPVMIGVMAKKAADQGIQWFFEMFALFNIILAITNLLPLPILDGGHIVFTTIESIIRRPLPAKFMAAVFNVFMWLLIALAVILTFNDVISNLWRIK